MSKCELWKKACKNYSFSSWEEKEHFKDFYSFVYDELEQQLEQAEGVIKNMMDHQASSISGNIPVAKLSTVYRIGENYFKQKEGGK